VKYLLFFLIFTAMYFAKQAQNLCKNLEWEKKLPVTSLMGEKKRKKKGALPTADVLLNSITIPMW